jgi:hypothetical protein
MYNQALMRQMKKKFVDDDTHGTGGGPCHLYGGGAPHQQINTQACGQSSQEFETRPSKSTGPAPGQTPSPVPGQSTVSGQDGQPVWYQNK